MGLEKFRKEPDRPQLTVTASTKIGSLLEDRSRSDLRRIPVLSGLRQKSRV